VIRPKANYTTPRSAHGFHKAFSPNKLYLGIAETVFPFNLAKLSQRHIVRILVFFNAGFKNLRLEYLEHVIRHFKDNSLWQIHAVEAKTYQQNIEVKSAGNCLPSGPL
jgi:hypothetical protein